MKYNLNIDRLKMCYTVDTSVALELCSFETENNFGQYKITPESNPMPPHEKSFNIQLYYPTKKCDWIDFATMSFGSKMDNEETLKKEKQYVWIELYNKVLYTSTTTDKNQSISKYIFDITDSLSFELNNITRLEIAYDCYKNMANRIKRAIMNNDIVPIVNGKAQLDITKVIDDVLYIRTANQLRFKTMSVYVKPKYDKQISLKAYDKGCEITKKKKEYVKDFVGMTDNFFRAEISLQNEPIKEYLNKTKTDVRIFLDKILESEDFRKQIFSYYSNRLLRFRTPDGMKSILDI